MGLGVASFCMALAMLVFEIPACKVRTMKAAPGTAGVEPAVRATAAHLPVDHYTTSPGAVAFVAVLTRRRCHLPGYVGEQCLDIATALEIELLVRAALLRQPQTRLSGKALRQRAFHVKLTVAGVARKFLGRPHERGVEILRVLVEVMRGRTTHRRGRLVMLLHLVLLVIRRRGGCELAA